MNWKPGSREGMGWLRRFVMGGCLTMVACGSGADADVESETPASMTNNAAPAMSSTSATGNSEAGARAAAPPMAATLTGTAGKAAASNTATAGAAATPPTNANTNTPAMAGAAAQAAGSPAAPSGGEAGPGGATDTAGIPCDAFAALARACHHCHGAVPSNGAPMPLVKIADFTALSVGGKPKIPKYELARMRMDGSRNPPMPPATTPITDEDKKTLIDWLSAGAPPDEAASCP